MKEKGYSVMYPESSESRLELNGSVLLGAKTEK